MLPPESVPDPLQAQRLAVPPREDCPVRRLQRLCMCLSSMCPLICLPLDATINLFWRVSTSTELQMLPQNSAEDCVGRACSGFHSPGCARDKYDAQKAKNLQGFR